MLPLPQVCKSITLPPKPEGPVEIVGSGTREQETRGAGQYPGGNKGEIVVLARKREVPIVVVD